MLSQEEEKRKSRLGRIISWFVIMLCVSVFLIIAPSKANNNSFEADSLIEKYQYHPLIPIDTSLHYLKLAENLAFSESNYPVFLKALYVKIKLYDNLLMYDSVKVLSDSLYILAQEYKITNYEGKALNMIGLYWYNQQDFIQAISIFKKVLQMPFVDARLMSSVYNNIGIAFHGLGLLDSTLVYYQKSYDLNFRLNDILGMAEISYNLSILYSNLSQNTKALEYAQKSLALNLKLTNELNIANAYLNIGYVFIDCGLYDSVLYSAEKARNLFISHKIETGDALAMEQIASVLVSRNQLDSALSIYKQTSKIFKSSGDFDNLAYSHFDIAKILHIQKKLIPALSLLQEASGQIEKNGDLKTLFEIYELQYQCLIELSNYKDALKTLEKRNIIHEKLHDLTMEKNILEIESKYKLIQEELKVKELTEKLADKRKLLLRKNIIVILLSISLIITLFFIMNFFINQRKLRDRNLKIQLQADELAKKNDDLESLSEFKKNMTGMLVHDLKSPLGALLNISLIEDVETKDRLVEQSGHRMLLLIQNILDVFRYENTEMELNKRLINLESLVEHCIQNARLLSSNNTVQFKITSSIKEAIPVDEELIIRVFDNLLSNACKFAPIDSEIEINLTHEDDLMVRCSVLNHGPGIPFNKQESIFKLFSRAESRKLGSLSSTGIGLSFCVMAVDAHGGKMGVLSDGYQGAEFWFTLPRSL